MGNMGKKKSFIVYCDSMEHLELLDDAECGRLFRALMEYAGSGRITKLDGMAKMAFSFMRLQMDRDGQKYEEICQKNRRNGSKGGRPRSVGECETKITASEGLGESNAAAYEPAASGRPIVSEEHKASQKSVTAEEAGQIFLPEKTQRFFVKPKKPDTDTETETDTEIDTDTDTETAATAGPYQCAKGADPSILKEAKLSSCEEMRSSGTERRLKKKEPDKRSKQAAVCPFDQIMEQYNSICTDFPRINGISGARRQRLSALWKAHPSINEFSKAFGNVQRSSFLKSKRWADFDWMIDRDKFNRIIEGRYDDEPSMSAPSANTSDTVFQSSFDLDRWELETLGIGG